MAYIIELRKFPDTGLRARLAACLVLLGLTGPVFAAAAGRVIFTSGSPQALDTTGISRVLKRGDDVFSGDRLTTDPAARVQVSFVDGAYISLQPNSEYEIEQYQYSGQPDGTERATYRLLRGGVRALTGLIGKKDPETYKVHTPVATIGIRGTGHNTRLCQGGDCPGAADGLYHNTWEGTTYVVNDVSSVDVATGRGVFVEALDKPIIFLDQAPGVTAVETGKQRQAEHEEEEDRSNRFIVGDQRDEDGDQIIVRPEEEPPPPPPDETSKVLAGQALVAVNPDPSQPDRVEVAGFPTTNVLLNEDGKPIGALGDEVEESAAGGEILVRTLGTIDLDAALGADDPAVAAEVQSLVDSADPAQIDFFRQDPMEISEFATVGEIAFGRWSDGRLLVISEGGDVDIEELTGFQSVHFIYGPEAGPTPTTGFASYSFAGGTQSTSASGDTIGEGVTEGLITVDFGVSNAFLEMDISHAGTDYSVAGDLSIDLGGPKFHDRQVFATTGSPDSACNPMCPTFIDGLFLGPSDGNIPKHMGLEYDIQDADVVMGVAAFALDTGP